MQDKVLISGFEPFDGDTVNPAREVLSLLEGRVLNGFEEFNRFLSFTADLTLSF